MLRWAPAPHLVVVYRSSFSAKQKLKVKSACSILSFNLHRPPWGTVKSLALSRCRSLSLSLNLTDIRPGVANGGTAARSGVCRPAATSSGGYPDAVKNRKTVPMI
ncbi:hypothetical protein Nepgr_003120 [Nepenthes gracilis]|uniref:Uncharacterized protein n=1 Tax=Nepenthes gracilis TaxID=150966 RepID=A0AAD3RYW9_NEPGR|nr:hypothetical protein Nepgr_003120 [Nepenthes gracilis]